MANEKNKKYRAVKYQKHGILSKSYNPNEETWIFETQGDIMEFHGAEITDIFDDLSMEGYDLICYSDEGYIFRTRIEIEETLEYFETT